MPGRLLCLHRAFGVCFARKLLRSQRTHSNSASVQGFNQNAGDDVIDLMREPPGQEYPNATW